LTTNKKGTKKMNIEEKLGHFVNKIEQHYYDLEIFLDCRIGNAVLTVEELINLKIGDVIELDKMAGDGADMFANNRIIARAEIMVFEENFALRVNEATSYNTAFKYFLDEQD